MTATAAARARVLYIVYWGALEPLGQSLVVPAVRRLSQIGVDLTLITFEKAADLVDAAAVDQLRADLEAAGVRWRPLKYHKTPKWPATVFDSLAALFNALRLSAGGRFDLVHARTFVAGPMGYLIARALRTRFVYHNEGFYPDEQVDGGVWREGSFIHRFAKRVEAFLYDHADGTIVLSERARDVVRVRPRVEASNAPVIVVPSAVDLGAFRPASHPRSRAGEGVHLVYLGSVGLRYRLDQAGRFVKALRQLVPGSFLTVVSRAERSLVESMLDSSGLSRDAWTLKGLPHSAVPGELVLHDAGLLFWPQGLSEYGCSPTKAGEYWACGLPIVTTPNVSDMDAIVARERVGVITDPGEADSLVSAAVRLVSLLADPATRERCRHAAETFYSLETACKRQQDLYLQLRP